MLLCTERCWSLSIFYSAGQLEFFKTSRSLATRFSARKTVTWIQKVNVQCGDGHIGNFWVVSGCMAREGFEFSRVRRLQLRRDCVTALTRLNCWNCLNTRNLMNDVWTQFTQRDESDWIVQIPNFICAIWLPVCAVHFAVADTCALATPKTVTLLKVLANWKHFFFLEIQNLAQREGSFGFCYCVQDSHLRVHSEMRIVVRVFSCCNVLQSHTGKRIPTLSRVHGGAHFWTILTKQAVTNGSCIALWWDKTCGNISSHRRGRLKKALRQGEQIVRRIPETPSSGGTNTHQCDNDQRCYELYQPFFFLCSSTKHWRRPLLQLKNCTKCSSFVHISTAWHFCLTERICLCKPVQLQIYALHWK